ncbi:protein moonraker [Melanotaenia boesemani]|uniref:protein moonraker n=1 Tax=Melanotaenia boesemani TaxID=1250792 RepID=UPI001C047CB5|nr:protein moonraker [Melanotaenia boesemani]
MAAQFLHSGPLISVVQQTTAPSGWIPVCSTQNVKDGSDLTTRTSQTKLLFNEDIPASAINRATRVGPPAPIVIERLFQRSEVHESSGSIRSSFTFTALSEERLQSAVKLAQRDLRRRHRESFKKFSSKPSQEATLFETSDVELLQDLATSPSKTKIIACSPKEKVAQSGAKQNVSKKILSSSFPRVGNSPPTRDPGPRQGEGGKQAPLSHEIHKLQNELEVYIQKVEELANRGDKMAEPLEPEEQNKLEMRRQKQEARSVRVIYALQQQVKEVQEDIEKLKKEKMWDTKKYIAINRLAAAHRGALRALQVIIHQLSDLNRRKVPLHYKELGQLIRQLSLCSAKIEVDQGSAVPQTALSILQKLETVESILSKHEVLEKMQVQACPQRRKSPHHSTSPAAAPKGPSMSAPRKPANHRRGVRAGKKMPPQKPKTVSHQPLNRREVLMAGVQSISQQRELRERQGQTQTHSTCRKGRQAERRKAHLMKHNQMQDAGFQQPTVSSRLRENQLPQREHSVPWIPTSPHSPPQRSPQRGRPEPRCLFSPVKPSSSPPKQQVGGGSEEESTLSSAKRKEAPNEALGKAWLDKLMMQRLKKFNHLSKEDAEHAQRLRSETVSPTQWGEGAEQKAREGSQPLLDEVKQTGDTKKRINSSQSGLSEQAAERAAESAEQLSEALLEDLLEDTALVAWAAETDRQLEGMAQRGLQAPTLESMLLRMEEMQRYEEEVRRKFASITYSDPLYWEQPRTTGSQCHASGSRPASPQPIRLTRPVLKQTSAADIILEKPVETGFLIDNSPPEEASQDEQVPTNSTAFPGLMERSRRTVLSVPSSMLRNIRSYHQDYNTYLRAVVHEAIGSFNPWAVADSLSEELLSEALADVAAEFQDVVEEYAEALFTSEFLQPI